MRITPILTDTTQVPLFRRFPHISHFNWFEINEAVSVTTSTFTIPVGLHHSAYRWNCCSLGTVPPLVSFPWKTFNGRAKYLHCAFLNYSSAFDLVPRFVLLNKLHLLSRFLYLLEMFSVPTSGNDMSMSQFGIISQQLHLVAPIYCKALCCQLFLLKLTLMNYLQLLSKHTVHTHISHQT